MKNKLTDAFMDLQARKFSLEILWSKLTAFRPDIAQLEFENITKYLEVILKESPNLEKITQDFDLRRIDVLEKYLPGEMKKFRQALGQLIKAIDVLDKLATTGVEEKTSC